MRKPQTLTRVSELLTLIQLTIQTGKLIEHLRKRLALKPEGQAMGDRTAIQRTDVG